MTINKLKYTKPQVIIKRDSFPDERTYNGVFSVGRIISDLKNLFIGKINEIIGTDWVDIPALQNSWVINTTTVKYKKLCGMVEIQGGIDTGTTTDTTLLFTFPVDFRPQEILHFTVAADTTVKSAQLQVGTNGQVTIHGVYTWTTATLYLDNIKFSVS